MSADMLQRILTKVASELHVTRIWLLQWTEPLLHPQLPDLVRLAKRFAPTVISTGASVCRCNLKDLVAAEPDDLLVAMSGWSREVYQTTHEGGDPENVKAFMVKLHELKARNVSLLWHRYANNIDEEDLARAFARRHGFIFRGWWAVHNPVQDLIAGKGNPYLVLSVPERLQITRDQEKYQCPYLSLTIDIDVQGDIRNCCVSHVADRGNVFTHSAADFLRRRMSLENPLCKACYGAGAYKIASGLNLRIDRECARRVGKHQARYWFERTKKAVWMPLATRKKVLVPSTAHLMGYSGT